MSKQKETLPIQLFIYQNRLRDKQKLYEPKYICEGNIIHSDYVYMRMTYERESNSEEIVYDGVNNVSCSNSYSKFPCITLKGLNDKIKEDNQYLEELIEYLESEKSDKQIDEKYQELIKSGNNAGKQAYEKTQGWQPKLNFLKDVKEALDLYKNKKYTQDFLYNLQRNCSIKPIVMENYRILLDKTLKQLKKNGEFNFNLDIPDMNLIDFYTSSPITGVSSKEMEESRKLLQKITQQIINIEMKTQLNKTKLGTLVQQYSVLKQIRKTVDKRIGAMQSKIDELNQKKDVMGGKIEDLKSEIRILNRNKQNLQKEIEQIKKEQDLSSQEKRNKIRQLNNVKNDLENENFQLKKQIASLINHKKAVESENKKMQSELKKQQQDLVKTEQHLKNISSKLNSLDVKVSENKIDEKLLLKQPELDNFESNIDSLIKKSVQKQKKQPVRRKRKQTIRRKRKTKSSKSKEIKVKVKKRPRKKRKNKDDDDDDELIFNFSLRNLM
jgi:hypothetical protein